MLQRGFWFLLAAVYFATSAVAAAAVLAGGSGRALLFEGDRNAEVRSPVYNDWGSGDEITISIWFRQSVPGQGSIGKTEGFNGNAMSLFAMNAVSSNAAEDNYPFKCQAPGTDFAVSGYGYEAAAAYFGDKLLTGATIDAAAKWYHFVLTWNASDGLVHWYVFDGSSNSSTHDVGLSSCQGTPLPSSAYFTLGAPTYVSDSPFAGVMDDFCVFNTQLSSNDVDQLHAKGCAAVAPDRGLFVNMRHDESFGSAEPKIFDDVAQAHIAFGGGLMGGFQFASGAVDSPRMVASDAPIMAGLTVARCSSDQNACVIKLDCMGCDAVAVASLTSTGALSQWDVADEEGSLGAGIATAGQSVLASSDGSGFFVAFQPPDTVAAGGGDTFTFAASDTASGDIATATVEIVYNTAPVATNFSVTLAANGVTVTHVPPQHHAFDADNDILTATLLTLPDDTLGLTLYDYIFYDDDTASWRMDCTDDYYYDDYYYSSSTSSGSSGRRLSGEHEYEEYTYFNCQVIHPDNLLDSAGAMLADDSQRFVITHEGTPWGDGTVGYIEYQLFDGLAASNTAFIAIQLEAANACPTSSDSEIAMDEDETVEIALNVADQEGDPIYITVNALPEHGTLYQVADSASGERGDALTDIASSDSIVQYASAVPRGSEEWCEAGCGYSLEDAVGEANLFPMFGNAPGSWQPRGEGDYIHETWIEVAFETPVFASELELYEVWTPGSAIRISVLPLELEETHLPSEDEIGYDQWDLPDDLYDDWVVVWEGEGTLSLYDPADERPSISTYRLCPKPFMTRSVRIEFDLINYDYWLAIDAVQLTGSGVLAANVVTSSSRSLIFEPAPNFAGDDAFSFAVSDCGFFLESRTLYESDRTATVSLRVDPLNDAPEMAPVVVVPTMPTSAGGDAQATTPHQLLLADLVTEVDGDAVTFTVESLPGDNVLLYSSADITEAAAITAAGSTLTGDKLFIVATDCQATSFLVSASDGLATSAAATISVEATGCLPKCEAIGAACLEDGDCDFSWTTGACNNDGEMEVSYARSSLCSGGAELPPTQVLTCDYVPEGSFVGALVLALSVLGAVICFVLLAGLTIHRRTPVVKASQFIFCALFLIGGASVSLVQIAFLGPPTDASCATRTFLANFTFTFMFSGLFTKVWRAHRIFENRRLVKVELTDRALFKRIGFVCGIEVLLQVAWRLADPAEVKEVEEEVVGGGVIARYECGSDEGTFPTLAVVFKAALLLAGCYLSWKTRNINVAFAESRQIFIGNYLITILGGLTFILVAGFGLAADAAMTMQVLGVFLSVTTATLTIFVPKLLMVGMTREELQSVATSDGTSGSTSDNSNKGMPIQVGSANKMSVSARSVQVLPDPHEETRGASSVVVG